MWKHRRKEVNHHYDCYVVIRFLEGFELTSVYLTFIFFLYFSFQYKMSIFTGSAGLLVK